MSQFCMPSLGADMDAGTLMEWLIKPGDPVRQGQVVAVVETQKGLIEIEIFEAGIVDQLMVSPGTEVPVGTALALIRQPGETLAAEPIAEPPPLPPTALVPTPEPAHPRSTRARISPAARRRARELDINIDTLSGSGPEGAITLEDIEKAVAIPPAALPSPPPLEGMRAAIASAMSRSKREIPHYYLSHTLDLTPALAWLTQTNATRPVTDRLIPAILLVKAVGLALRQFKELNGHCREGHFEPAAQIHVGMAISLRSGGLVAPALHQVDQKDLNTLMAEFLELVNRARSNQLHSSEMSDGTITITSLGDQGVEAVYPVIYPPQVAMVGFGTVLERPWVVEGQVVPRRVITVSLSGDHRVSDGHRGALFLAKIEKLLQQPEAL